MSAPSSSGRQSTGVAKVLSHAEQGAALMGQLRTRCQIGDRQPRIAGRFDPHQLGVRLKRLGEFFEVRRIRLRDRHSIASEHLVEAAGRRRRKCQPRPAGDRPPSAAPWHSELPPSPWRRPKRRSPLRGWRRSSRGFPRRIAAAGIVKLPPDARFVLDVGAGQINRRHDRPGGRIARRTDVNCPRTEFHRFPPKNRVLQTLKIPKPNRDVSRQF